MLRVSLSSWQLVILSFALAFVLLLLALFRYLYQDPFPEIDGPPSSSLIFGHFPEILREEVGVVYDRWHQLYGPVYKLRGFMGATRLVVLDPVAAKHMMVTKVYSYGKHKGVRTMFGTFQGSLLGIGSLEVTGEDHRRIRKLFVQTFTTSHTRSMHPTVREFADQCVDLLRGEKEQAEYDFLRYMKLAALDIIAATSCGYATGVLRRQDTPLAIALDAVISQVSNNLIRVPVPAILRAYLPSLDWWLFSDTRLLVRGVAHLRKIAYEVLYTRKQSFGVLTEADKMHIKKTGLNIDRERVGNFALGIDDALSTMLQNAAMLDPDDPEKLDDEWILAQIVVLLWAGHEPTATSLTWLFYELSRNLDVQAKLREELVAAGLDCDVRTLLELPYLNGVVHESLRLHSTSGQSIRHAFEDDIVPLSAPVNGHRSIVMPKGTEIVFNHMSMNCRKSVWGADAMEFKPERWLNLPAVIKEGMDIMPGWQNLANFSSGNRQCVGAGFATMEIKEITLRLLTHFEFSLPDDPAEREIEGWNRLITKPFVKREGSKAMPRLPIKIRPLQKA